MECRKLHMVDWSIRSCSTEGLELKGWVNDEIVESFQHPLHWLLLNWPPRYTSIHELNKIINSPSIFRLSSLVLAPLQKLSSSSWIRIYTVILYTVTDSAGSRFDVHLIWHIRTPAVSFAHIQRRIQVKCGLMKKCRSIKRCSCPTHQGKQEVEKTLTTYFWELNFCFSIARCES